MTEQAKTLGEVRLRLETLNDSMDPLDAHFEADLLLLDALVLLKQSDIVGAFLGAKHRCRFDY